MTAHRWFFSRIAIASLLALPAWAQSVVSTRSGLIHFTDGSVFLNDERVEQKFGKFVQMKDGSELWTQDGRAEVILTPGVFLRVGPNSAIRMVSNNLMDTRVEVFRGSSVLESADALSNAVTIIYKDYQTHISKAGRYRFNCEPPELRVESGQAEISFPGKSKIVETGYVLPFFGGLTARQFDGTTPDALDDWNRTRNDALAQDNTEAGKTSDLAETIDQWQNDPDALLAAQGMSSYIPSVPYAPLSTYSPLSGYGGPLSAYNPFAFTPGFGILPYWGIGAIGMYPSPLYRYYPYSTLGLPPGYLGSSLFGRRGTLGISHPVVVRPVTPMHTGVGIGHIGGRR